MNQYCNHCMSVIQPTDKFCPVCGKTNEEKTPAHHLLPGTMLLNRFYVGYALGEGGFGITYIGFDTKLNMKVAIKEFYPNGFVSRSNTISAAVNDSVTQDRKEFFEKGRERFLEEARILAKFSGEPGIVDVRDFFEENNTAYIIMEFLDGVDMKTYIKNNGLLSDKKAVEMLMPVMESLKKVHAQGLIHRDISPDNIMVVGNTVKLLDFGAARNVSAEANKSLSVMLKPGYAPEEQYRSKGNQGPWTDVYALSATLYKAITGVTPDDATQRVFSDEVKTPSALNFTIDPKIEAAIMKGLSVNQNDRYQSVDLFIQGLKGIHVAPGTVDEVATMYLGNQATSAPVVPISAAPAAPVASAPAPAAPVSRVEATVMGGQQTADFGAQSSVAQPQTEAKKSKGLLIAILLGVIAIVVAGVVAIVVLSGGNGDSDSSEPDTDSKPASSQSESSLPAQSGDGSSAPAAENNGSGSSAPAASAPAVMSDDIYDFTFTLEGVVYQLPCSFQSFEQNGWTIGSNYSGITSDTKIAANNYESYTVAKNGKSITLYSYNKSGNAKAIKDCMVGGISCYADDNVSLTIAKGITPASTSAQVKSAFGTPHYNNMYDEYEVIQYYAEKDNSQRSIEFYCYADGSYSHFSMRNFVETAADQTTTNTTAPAYLATYKAPTAMGANLTSPVVKIEGQLYQFPCPVTAFLNNGWTITQQSGDLGAGNSDYITVSKNNKKITLRIANYADYQTTVENCAVYGFSIDDYEKSIPSVQIGSSAKPITIGTKKADLDAQWTFDAPYEGTYNHMYSYSEYKDRDFSLSIYVDKETGLVSDISISCKTWSY